MADELTEFELRRLETRSNNYECSPEEILRLALHDLRNGEVQANAVFVVLISKPTADGENGKSARYRAGLNRMEEIAYLQMCQERCLREWLPVSS